MFISKLSRIQKTFESIFIHRSFLWLPLFVTKPQPNQRKPKTILNALSALPFLKLILAGHLVIQRNGLLITMRKNNNRWRHEVMGLGDNRSWLDELSIGRFCMISVVDPMPISNLTRLQFLDLSQCCQLTDESVTKFRFPELRKLDLQSNQGEERQNQVNVFHCFFL